jgi:hypothetical protein
MDHCRLFAKLLVVIQTTKLVVAFASVALQKPIAAKQSQAVLSLAQQDGHFLPGV